MGTSAFDTHAIVCPHCAQPSRIHSEEPFNGLYTCPNCKTRLVVSWSGHFVRDPATTQRRAFRLALGRRHQALTHTIQELGVIPIVGLLSAIALGGMALANGFGALPEPTIGINSNPSSQVESAPSPTRTPPDA